MTKVAAITGGASGIGQGTARRLLGEGWTVVALDRDQAGLDALRKEFASHVDRLQTQVWRASPVRSPKSGGASGASTASSARPAC